MPILLILFIGVPLLEIYLFAQVGDAIGALNTVALVILTAVIGVYMLRVQGLSTWMRVQQAMAQGQPPAIEMIEGLILLVCGALLLTPGFFTDTLGFLMLVPGLRHQIARAVVARGMMGGFSGGVGGGFGGGFGGGQADPFTSRTHQVEEEVEIIVEPRHPKGPGSNRARSNTQSRPGDIIDGEYRREDD